MPKFENFQHGFRVIAFSKTALKTVEKTDTQILNLIRVNPKITTKSIQETTGLTRRGIEWQIQKLKEQNIIKRIGPDKGGHWEVKTKK